MKLFLLGLLSLCIGVSCILMQTPYASAADLRSDESVTVDHPLSNPYLAGNNIEVTAPVQNDVVAAGGTITLSSPVEGNVLAAGGTIDVRGRVDHSVRVAGGNITIDAPVGQDVLVFGGNTHITRAASVSGDILFFGGQLTVDGPVNGTIHMNGGTVTINAPVRGNVEGNVGSLKLGSQAAIGGNLTYKAGERASIADGASVSGKTSFQKSANHEKSKRGIAALLTVGTLYKLIGEIIIALLIYWLVRPFALVLFNQIADSPVRNTVLGFATLILLPIAGVILLLLFWLGLATLTFYIFLLLLTMVILPLFVGWRILVWLEQREKRTYELDWRAAIIGPIVMIILSIIPFIGWLIAFIIFLWVLGGIVHYIPSIAAITPAEKSPRKKR